MRLFTIFFLLGNCLVQVLPTLPSVRISFILFLGTVCLSGFFIYKRWQICVLLGAFCLGITWTCFYAAWQIQKILPVALEDRVLQIDGYVDSIPQRDFSRISFDFRIKTAQEGKKVLPWQGKIHLTWYHYGKQNLNGCCQPGQAWRFLVKLRRPHSYANLGSFDREAFALQNRIMGNGYIVRFAQHIVINDKRYSINQIRYWLDNQISHLLKNNMAESLIRALTIGNSQAIVSEQWRVLRNTGTTHLIAISGLHISLVAVFAYQLFSYLWRCSTRALLFLSAPQFAAFTGLLVAGMYSALAGFSLPTQRSFIMLAVFMLSTLLRRHIPAWQSYCLALLLILIYDPFATLSMGFWLSFVAVAGIGYVIGGRLHALGWWWKWGKVQWSITLGLLPISLLLFGQASLISFPANVIAIPWVSFFIVPISLIGCVLLPLWPMVGGYCIKLAAVLLIGLWKLLTWMAQLPATQLEYVFHSYGHFFFIMLAMVLCLAPRGWPKRYMGYVWLLLLLFARSQPLRTGEIRFTLLDVGQGLASVIQTANHVLIYDAGANIGGFDAGTKIVTPYLHARHIKTIDTIVISHADNDHSGGVKSLVDNFSVKRIFRSDWKNYSSDIMTLNCVAGMQWRWDSVDFMMLYPSFDKQGLGNNSSCVLQISAGKTKLLLTGDIERDAELQLLKQYGSSLRSTILVAPHHGSFTSSTREFIQAIQPAYVLFSTGYHNRFHFPKTTVINRYRELGAILYNTAETGAIEFILNDGELLKKPELYRIRHKKYWRN